MGVPAAPTTIEVPLPGGRPGATVRLHPLLAGEMLSPPGFFDRPIGPLAMLRGLGIGVPRSRQSWIPVPAFLVEHPGAGPVLIDTGFDPSMAIDPALTMGRAAAAVYNFRIAPGNSIASQIGALGIDAADVGVVVMTHLHFDHASGVGQFPNATFVAARREWGAAVAPRARLRGYYPQQLEGATDWRLLEPDGPTAEPFAGLERTIDLFGDGSVRLISTPGHTPGHLSVLLRLRGRNALLTGDAAYDRRTLDGERLPLLMADEADFERSLDELRRFVDFDPDALVIPGHDPEEWPALAAVYD